jgi:hypothetical protein
LAFPARSGPTLRLSSPYDPDAHYGIKRCSGWCGYQEIARLLFGARACHRTLGTDQQFTGYLCALRPEQKRKRNLMKILDQHGL